MGLRSSTELWKFGFRLEDLEYKIRDQTTRWNDIRKAISTISYPLRTTTKANMKKFENTRKAIKMLHALLVNNSNVFQIKCERDGPYIRIGMNDFRTDSRDACQIFTGPVEGSTGPQTMFEIVPHIEEDGSFGLRSVANGLFLRAVPPPPESSSLPWKIVVGGPSLGASERFYRTEDGYLYSPLINGVFQCAADQMVKGYSGKYGTTNHFIFEQISEEDVFTARETVDLSKKISKIQKAYSATHQTSPQARNAQVKLVTGMDQASPVRLCMAVPMTSKGTLMKSVADSPLWANLFDSFMKTIDWRSNRIIFGLYLGFDKADLLYDTGDAWTELRDEFRTRAEHSMRKQLVDNVTIAAVLERQLKIKIMHFEHLEGAPTQVVSQLVLQAYMDNYDYFYQINDDTVLVTPNWAPSLIAGLASNPSIPNLGVAGPVDTNNDKIFTHAFVHRTHVEVFGHLFPPSFKNWWSDDWISTVYGAEHTFRVTDVQIKHNVGSQKTKGPTRYEVDKGARLRLDDELRTGHVQLDQWLRKNALPRLALPEVCGYIPLARLLRNSLRSKVDKKTSGSSSTLSST